MWFGMALLVGLLVFIARDGRRLRAAKPDPIPREVMRKGYVPRGLIHWHFWLGMSAVAVALALAEWHHPSTPPFTGRGAWFIEIAYSAFGENALFFLFALAAGVAACCAFVLWRRSKASSSPT
jgi:hypothetical protein